MLDNKVKTQWIFKETFHEYNSNIGAFLFNSEYKMSYFPIQVKGCVKYISISNWKEKISPVLASSPLLTEFLKSEQENPFLTCS